MVQAPYEEGWLDVNPITYLFYQVDRRGEMFIYAVRVWLS